MRRAFVPKAFHPLVTALAGALVVFAVAENLLDLARGEIGAERNRADQRRAHDPFMPERQGKEDRDPLVRPALVFRGNGQPDVLPAGIPVGGEGIGDAVRAFGEQKKENVGPTADDIPRFGSPRVGVFQEEVGRETDAKRRAARHLVGARPVFGERISKRRFRTADLRPVPAVEPGQEEHIAVSASLAAFAAAVPRVPDIAQRRFQIGFSNGERRGRFGARRAFFPLSARLILKENAPGWNRRGRNVPFRRERSARFAARRAGLNFQNFGFFADIRLTERYSVM